MASINKVDLSRMYLEEKKSIPDISDQVGLSRSTVRYHLIKNGIELRTRDDGIRAASLKLGSGLRGRKRVFTEEWKARISSSKRALGEITAKGTSLKPNGYIEYTRGEHKGRSVHVVTMEKHIGRRLFGFEVVHHIDGNRQNNDLSNLELMTRSAHTKLHREGKHGKH